MAIALQIKVNAKLSLRDPEDTDKYVGRDALWDRAEQAIRDAVAESRQLSGLPECREKAGFEEVSSRCTTDLLEHALSALECESEGSEFFLVQFSTKEGA